MNRFLKGAMILTLAGVIVKVIGAFSKVLIARILGGEGIGLYQLAYPIYQIIVSISTAGIPVAISIMVAERLANQDIRGANKVFAISLVMLAGLGVIFSVGLYNSAQCMIDFGWVRDERALLAIEALSPAILLVTILSCFRGYFQGFQNMLPTGISQILEQSFRVVTMVALAYMLLPKGLEFAAAGATFATFPGIIAGLGVLLYFYYRQRTYRKSLLLQQKDISTSGSSVSIVKELFFLAIPVSMANIMMPLVSGIDMFIVPNRLIEAGYPIQEATTLYGYLTGMATSLVNLPIILTTSLAASLVPAVSEAYALGRIETIHERTNTALKIANLITIPAFVGLCVLAIPISQLLYATPHAGPPIAVMSLSIFFLGIQQVTTGILQGLGKTAIPMINLLLSTVVKVILSWYLIVVPELGINGAAWATNIDFGLAAALNVYFVNKYVGYRLDINNVCKIIISAMAMGGATAVGYHFLTSLLGNTLAVCISILIAIMIYLVSLWITKAINKEDIATLPIIGNKFSIGERKK
ncbi:putative polysaccharide biosynthesis protein [Veillonella montpellierensis]|uniref:putative polysaccharide biosynthesis protein n=1 Tax=Veillonella montpellierensis TaxID=187328 RepID=UPI0023F8EC10|nr:polysaccharide biosynthesis protein [Veillonella montpellierensis]